MLQKKEMCWSSLICPRLSPLKVVEVGSQLCDPWPQTRAVSLWRLSEPRKDRKTFCHPGKQWVLMSWGCASSTSAFGVRTFAHSTLSNEWMRELSKEEVIREWWAPKAEWVWHTASEKRNLSWAWKGTAWQKGSSTMVGKPQSVCRWSVAGWVWGAEYEPVDWREVYVWRVGQEKAGSESGGLRYPGRPWGVMEGFRPLPCPGCLASYFSHSL